ncbi:MAG TPA: DUF488 family protein [Clostridiales bacterium]|nr:DUF488 family protein [Clostridiales bacterium]
MALQIKRIYDSFQADDGIRLLVDRLWPRGVAKAEAHLDGWLKELAPSQELRQWFGHKAENFAEFAALYRDELENSPKAQEVVKQIIFQSKEHTVTLLYGAKDPKVNHAVVLMAYLNEKSKMV